MKKFWIKKVIGMAVCAALAIVAVGFVVMTIWNQVLVVVLGVKAVSYTQALGILVLSKILFGGFGKGNKNGEDCSWKKRGDAIKEKWHNMSEEEREKFKEDWRFRCRSWKETKDN